MKGAIKWIERASEWMRIASEAIERLSQGIPISN
jgi:hypothetical protein